MVERVVAKGGRLTPDGRLLFPKALVEEVSAAHGATSSSTDDVRAWRPRGVGELLHFRLARLTKEGKFRWV